MHNNGPRSIKSQFSHAITLSTRFGQSKHANKRNPDYVAKNSLSSVGRTEDMRGTANSFAKYLQTNHPEIKYVYQIQPEHAQGFLDTASKQGHGWTIKSGQENASRMSKLASICREAFSLQHDFSKGIRAAYKHDRKIRDKAMTEWSCPPALYQTQS